MNQTVTLIPSSPYSTLYPDKVLITRDELNLIKILRQADIEVNIKTGGRDTVNYVLEKGLKEFIGHPITLFVVGIPISVIINLYSSHLYDILSGSGKGAELIIQKQEDGAMVSYSQKGEKLSVDQIETIFNKSKELFFVEDYKGVKPTSPNPSKYPYPIYLEHTNRIAGWGDIFLGEQGLMLKNGVITDDQTQRLIGEGTLRGLSVTAVVKKLKCSVCEDNYFKCSHISGEKYAGVRCVNNITEAELVNINLVKEPINPNALLNLQSGEPHGR